MSFYKTVDNALDFFFDDKNEKIATRCCQIFLFSILALALALLDKVKTSCALATDEDDK